MAWNGLEVTPKVFFTSGIILFTVIGMANILSLINGWGYTTLPSKLGSMAGIIFNFITVGFFIYLKKTMTPQETNEVDYESIQAAIQEAKGVGG